MKGGKVLAEGRPSKVLTPPNIKKALAIEVDKLNHNGDFPYFVPKKTKARDNRELHGDPQKLSCFFLL